MAWHRARSGAVRGQAGCELLGDINFIEQLNYSWRHYRGPDGRVYGLNQQH